MSITVNIPICLLSDNHDQGLPYRKCIHFFLWIDDSVHADKERVILSMLLCPGSSIASVTLSAYAP